MGVNMNIKALKYVLELLKWVQDMDKKKGSWCSPRVVYHNVYVPHRSKDVNDILGEAHQKCRGDGGVGTVLLFPYPVGNWEVLCAWGHEAYTNSGMRL